MDGRVSGMCVGTMALLLAGSAAMAQEGRGEGVRVRVLEPQVMVLGPEGARGEARGERRGGRGGAGAEENVIVREFPGGRIEIHRYGEGPRGPEGRGEARGGPQRDLDVRVERRAEVRRQGERRVERRAERREPARGPGGMAQRGWEGGSDERMLFMQRAPQLRERLEALRRGMPAQPEIRTFVMPRGGGGMEWRGGAPMPRGPMPPDRGGAGRPEIRVFIEGMPGARGDGPGRGAPAPRRGAPHSGRGQEPPAPKVYIFRGVL